MSQIDLQLTLETTQYISSLRKAETANIAFHKKSIEATNQQKGAIELLEDEVVRLTELKKKSQSVAEIGVYNDRISKAQREMQKLNTTTRQGVREASQLGRAFKSIGGQIAGAFAITGLISSAISSIKQLAAASLQEFLDGQEESNKLKFALRGRVDVQDRLIQQAKELQNATRFDSGDLIKQQAFLAQQGRTENQIRKTIAAAVELSTVTGDDVATSVEKLDKVWEGQIGRLGTLDATWKDLIKTQNGAEKVIDAIAIKYKGFAEEDAKSSQGQLDRLNIQWKEVKESIGGAIVAVVNFVKESNDISRILKMMDQFKFKTKDVSIIDFSKFKEEQKKFTDETVAGINTTKAAFNNQVKSIEKLNEGDTTRNFLLAKLNTQYPLLFKNIDIQKIKYGELTKLTREQNNEFEARKRIAEAEGTIAISTKGIDTLIFQRNKLIASGKTAESNEVKTLDNLININTEKIKSAQLTISQYDKLIKKEEQLTEATEDELKAREQIRKEFDDALKKLLSEAEKAQIELIAENDIQRIELERQSNQKLIEEAEVFLRKRGKLTQEAEQAIITLKEVNNQRALKATQDFHKKERDEISKRNLEGNIQAAENFKSQYELLQDLKLEEADLIDSTGKARLMLEGDFLKRELSLKRTVAAASLGIDKAVAEQEIKVIEAKIKDIDDLISKSPVEKTFLQRIGIVSKSASKEDIDILNDVASVTKGLIDDVLDAEAALIDKRIANIDRLISKQEEALKIEEDAAKNGLANSVNSERNKQQLLLAEREKAVKAQERITKIQNAFDTVQQTSSLITTSAELFKSSTKIFGVAGPFVAAGLIAAMIGLFAASKIKASQATKLAEGGTGTKTGMIKGKSHSQGGERFIEHVEVEGGEMWGVLNKSASNKFKDVFPSMVDMMNKGIMPNVIVNKNIESKSMSTKRMEQELTSINQNIVQFLGRTGKTESETGRYKVIRIGNKTRKIKK